MLPHPFVLAPALRRRAVLALPAAWLLPGCGFELRQPPKFAFATLYTAAPTASALVNELKANLSASGQVKVLTQPRERAGADVVLDVLTDLRERVIVGYNASGQIRELQLRLRLKFLLRTPQEKLLIPETELLLVRDVSYRETVALAKEAEEALLYREMQSDIVQQVMRRLAAVKSL